MQRNIYMLRHTYIYTYIFWCGKGTSYVYNTHKQPHTHTDSHTHTPTRIANYLQNNGVMKWIFLIHLIEGQHNEIMCYFQARGVGFSLLTLTQNEYVHSTNKQTNNTHTRARRHTYTYWLLNSWTYINTYLSISIYTYAITGHIYIYTYIYTSLYWPRIDKLNTHTHTQTHTHTNYILCVCIQTKLNKKMFKNNQHVFDIIYVWVRFLRS